MNISFIGITDFFLPEQVAAMLQIAQKHQQSGELTRKVGVGVMMSHKTLNGLPSRFPGAFPERKEIAKIFRPDPRLFNVLHYTDYKEQAFYNSLCHAVDWSGPFLQALQLDMTWPSKQILRNLRANHSRLKLILQVGVKAFEAIHDNPDQLVQKIDTYGNDLDYVLLDKSMGQGKALDANFLIPFLEILTEKRPDLGLVVGGGLGPDTLSLLKPLIQRFPQISWDAEGQLRTSRDLKDPIEWNRARQYLNKSFQLCAKNKRPS